MRLPLPLLAVFLAAAASAAAAVVGTNPPALSLTAGRIAALPAAQQGPWRDYLERSDRRREADHAFVAAELKAAGLAQPVMPQGGGFGRGTMPLDQPADWYASAYALQSADAIVSYQLPNGGWGKNLAMHDHIRRPGESFIGNNVSRYLEPDDYDTPHDRYWNYFGTLDNNATTTQLRFLARVATAVGPEKSAPYRAAFLRGVDYLLAAQYPNGGWPQVWPLEGGYHDAITINDNAVDQTAEVLQGVAEGRAPYAFVPAALRPRAAAALARAVDCLLACQIRAGGRRTVWCQQHDPLTLAPTSARNFEPPAQCSAESAAVVEFLMDLPHPGPAVVTSVDDAVAWFRKTAIYGQAWQRGPHGFRPGGGGPGGGDQRPGAEAPAAGAPPADRVPVARPAPRLVPTPGAGPIWARYYETGTDRPVFGDRDKTIHDQVADLSPERQRGYEWYADGPKDMLDRFAAWSAAHPAPAR